MSYDSLKEEEYRTLLEETECYLTKHAGEAWSDVIKRDRSYARWAAESLDLDGDLVEALFWGVDNLHD